MSIKRGGSNRGSIRMSKGISGVNPRYTFFPDELKTEERVRRQSILGDGLSLALSAAQLDAETQKLFVDDFEDGAKQEAADVSDQFMQPTTESANEVSGMCAAPFLSNSVCTQ